MSIAGGGATTILGGEATRWSFWQLEKSKLAATGTTVTSYVKEVIEIEVFSSDGVAPCLGSDPIGGSEPESGML